MIKHLLKKYHYPPEEAANALETVIKQCEQWTVNKRFIQPTQPRCTKSMRMEYRWLQNHSEIYQSFIII
nr:type I restriction enzyme endonuclease domain-containing protein [Prevotella dentasini]